MVSPPQSTSTTSNPASPPKLEAQCDKPEKGKVHSVKYVQFLGRKTPIFYQNENGSCALLAICNLLSLKDSLNWDPKTREVPQEELLSLVTDRLIVANTKTDNKDALLPQLTTGTHVNIRFKRINDFVSTPEPTIFDLLDIPLYHGWIVDPQDTETADAIGSKSYDDLLVEFVALETKLVKTRNSYDNVDFVATTNATLGVPSPNLSRGHSFDDSPPDRARKGDLEEEAHLLRILKLSEEERYSYGAADGVVADVSLGTHLETVEDNATEEMVKDGTSDSESFSSQIYPSDEAFSSSNDGNEHIYEGESVRSEQVNSKDGISVKQGEFVRNFLKNSVDQLTEYGLSCLKENVKEREICVLFRNNHFSTMFKYEGGLYLLVTDQGFFGYPDLVWEKLNKVNGDNVYMTSNFEEYKIQDRSDCNWDEQNAMVKTADYLAIINSADENSSFNSDWQLAMALQKDFDEQQQQLQHNLD